jgi:peptidoglycan-associated lipoprotein
MLTRSTRSSSFRRVLLLTLLVAVIGATGCSQLPREHWWQFWRKKPTTTASIYNPDQVTVPPPPEAAGAAGGGTALMPGAGGETLPAPPGGVTDSDPLRRKPAGDVAELRSIYFNYDSDAISPENEAILNSNAAFLQANPAMQIQIQGHADERGTQEYNFNLGDRRAKAVKGFLMSKGIQGERLHTISFGKDRPMDAGHGETSWSRNRRVQFQAY